MTIMRELVDAKIDHLHQRRRQAVRLSEWLAARLQARELPRDPSCLRPSAHRKKLRISIGLPLAKAMQRWDRPTIGCRQGAAMKTFKIASAPLPGWSPSTH